MNAFARSAVRQKLARPWRWTLLGLWLLSGSWVHWAHSAEPFQAAIEDLRSGDYADVIESASKALEKPSARGEDWSLLLIESLMTVGKYPEAHTALTNALAKNNRSIRLRWIGQDVVRYNGRSEEAGAYLNQIGTLVRSRPTFYSEPPDFVVVGRMALGAGADPKDVMSRVFEPLQKASPEYREIYLTRGELALAKHDFDLAAKAFAAGLKQHPDDPDLHYGMALAFQNGDREQMGDSLQAALKKNPRHLPSLLLLANHKIDAEEYEVVGKLIEEVRSVNPWHPEAWAFTAVLAHLRNDMAGEAAARATALRFWTNNPRVDHLIGLKLSQKYRFKEGAERQRASLAMDPAYLPAKAQLASDLLRLGNDPEGWRLAQEVNQADAYDVTAYNLVTLRDSVAKYATLTNRYFVVRMAAREADVFGARVLELLTRARETLGAKYGVAIQDPTTVEIFQEQKDFGVRTFGMPDNPGYLGVCFGRVITANSPSATKGMSVNWEAVLWHEFCHVVTLQYTANRMPRWLSEGISVYEELQENKAWGQRMTPRYREMIFKGELTPISKLSGAFLAPKTPFHLQFAYYESALVVEFLVERYGLDKVRAILGDLREGVEINASIAKHTAPMSGLEKDFGEYATARARALAPGLDFEKPKSGGFGSALAAPTIAPATLGRATNYWVLMQQAQELVSTKKWAEAKAPLQQLLTLYPAQTGKDSAYPLLSHVHRVLGETNEELAVLRRYAAEDDEASDAYLRLAELGAAAGDWPEVRRNSERFLSVNPLVAAPYRYLALAAENQGQPAAAIAAHRTLLLLDPPNPSEVHYRLARLLHQTGDAGAKRQLLMALEDAPRHRAGLELLLELNRTSTNAPKATP